MASVFTPIFFVSVGASVDLRLLDPVDRRRRAGTLAVAAGRSSCSRSSARSSRDGPRRGCGCAASSSGVGMVPRGEVGLIFADIGRRSGVLSNEVFGAILLVVMVTTFIAPPALKALFGRPASPA